MKAMLRFKCHLKTETKAQQVDPRLLAVRAVLSQLNLKNYKKLHFIGKSLGALVLQRYIESSKFNKPETFFTILGYLVGEVNIQKLIVNLHIIQGQLDPHGAPEAIESEMKNSISKNKQIDVVNGGDHSYRNSEKQPVFQDYAISLIKM
jgi:dienelactone hydrolase